MALLGAQWKVKLRKSQQNAAAVLGKNTNARAAERRNLSAN
jgi:hypothetical protein